MYLNSHVICHTSHSDPLSGIICRDQSPDKSCRAFFKLVESELETTRTGKKICYPVPRVGPLPNHMLLSHTMPLLGIEGFMTATQNTLMSFEMRRKVLPHFCEVEEGHL